MEDFRKNDEGYVLWLNKNRKGYVLNAYNPPSARYLIAHRADCKTINNNKPARGKDWTVKYIKICGQSLAELTKWTMQHFGKTPHCCKLCSPES